MSRLTAADLIALVLDEGSWSSWDVPPVRGDISEEYAAELAAAAEKSGVDESVLSGEGLMHGRRVAVVVGEFKFLAGSIGRAAADRLVLAIERATAEGLPLLAAPVSGGTRMQEGTPAFVQMVRITQAVAAHKDAGLPYLVYLRHPTTGGVMASWGSLGHVTVAEPGALVGFLGPRVYEALYGKEFPADVQTSENLYARGIIDAVVPPEEIAGILDRALTILLAPRHGIQPVPEPVPLTELPDVDTWDAVVRSRRPDRPGVRRLLKYAASDVIPLNGTGQGEHDPGLLIALVRFGEAPCVFLGQDRRGQTADHPMGPEALREARRGMRLASELGLPLVTVIDTQGAALSAEAEEGDEEHHLTISDRKKDVIKRGAENVSASEVEGVLMEHAGHLVAEVIRRRFAAGQWCLPGVMVHMDELLVDAARRALRDKKRWEAFLKISEGS